MIIIETSLFTKQVQKLLSDEEYRHLQSDLANRPDMGAIIPKSGGLRKVRWRYRGKGKRGGVRIIYFWQVSKERLLMLLMYPKNVQDNLTPVQLKLLKQIVEDEYL
ncbi:MAG: type II toxin-antitoxin system RelE/ParE family toxin [Chloroflexi bacterium]|nr:type II toxin-antitoxin system RelE/ParE family toxin [Chloroflexota bacterium]